MATEFLKNYIFVTVGTVGRACTIVLQEVVEIDAKSRINRLLEILTEKGEYFWEEFQGKKKDASNHGRVQGVTKFESPPQNF